MLAKIKKESWANLMINSLIHPLLEVKAQAADKAEYKEQLWALELKGYNMQAFNFGTFLC